MNIRAIDVEEKSRRFGQLVRRYKQARGWTNQTIAQLVYDDPLRISTVSDIMNARYTKTGPTDETVFLYRTGLGIEQSEIDEIFATNQNSNVPAHFPEQDTIFVGHGKAKATLAEFLLDASRTSLIASGMAGVGKTETVLQSVEEFKSKNVGKSFRYFSANGFATKHPNEDNIQNFLTKIIGTFFPNFPFDKKLTVHELGDIWKSISKPLETIIVVDDVLDDEHWASIRPHKDVKTIAISRTKLSDFDCHISLEPLSTDDGARLAHRVIGTYQRTDINFETAKRLAGACDGLPLAIRVLASAMAQNPAIRVDEFLNRVENVQKEMPLSEDWENRVKQRLRLGLEILPVQILNFWSRLALFEGSFLPQDLEAMDNAEEGIANVSYLVKRNLILTRTSRKIELNLGHSYKLHDIMRAIALEYFLGQPADYQSKSKSQYANYFHHVLMEIESLYKSEKLNNIKYINELFYFHIGKFDKGFEYHLEDDDLDAGQRATEIALSDTLDQRLPASRRLEMLLKASSVMARRANLDPESHSNNLQKLLLKKAQVHRELSQFNEAEKTLFEGIAQAEQSGSEANLAAFWATLAGIYRIVPNKTEAALDACEKSLDYLDSGSGSRADKSATLNTYGNVLLQLGNYETAKDAYETALSIDVGLGDIEGMAVCFGNLANISIHQGLYEDAVSLAQKAVNLEAQLELLQSKAQSLQILGKAQLLLGNSLEAKTSFQEALNHHQEMENHQSVTKALTSISAIEFQMEQLDAAKSLAKTAIRNAVAYRHLSEAAGAIRTIAMIFDAESKYHMALKTITCSIRFNTASHKRTELNEDLLGLAIILFHQGRNEEAEKYRLKALQYGQEYEQTRIIKEAQRMADEFNDLTGEEKPS